MGQILYEARNLSNTVEDESQQCQSTKNPGMEDVHEHMTKAARRARYSGGVLNYVKKPGDVLGKQCVCAHDLPFLTSSIFLGSFIIREPQ